jgi:hypothetical protein
MGRSLPAFFCCSSTRSQRSRDFSIRLFIHRFIFQTTFDSIYGQLVQRVSRKTDLRSTPDSQHVLFFAASVPFAIPAIQSYASARSIGLSRAIEDF